MFNWADVGAWAWEPWSTADMAKCVDYRHTGPAVPLPQPSGNILARPTSVPKPSRLATPALVLVVHELK